MKTIDSDKLIERIEKMGEQASIYSKAKAELEYIKEYRKSLKSLLMIQAPEEYKTDKMKEAYAYSHQEYRDLLSGMNAASETERENWWALERLKIEVEVWRTMQANERWQKDRV